MNLSFSLHKKILHASSSRKKTVIKGALYRKENPDHVWHVLLFCFFAILILSGLYHLRLFYYVESGKGEVIPVEVEASTLRIRSEKLEYLLALFGERKTESDAIKAAPRSFSDPSL